MNDPNEYHVLIDAYRLRAEACCTDPQIWLLLAEAYTELGRPCQAACCRERAKHYAKEQSDESHSRIPA